jgi:hypothetical protein
MKVKYERGSIEYFFLTLTKGFVRILGFLVLFCF